MNTVIDMNLRQLEIFATITDKGSFTAAATELSMAQPAVSLAVRKLEAAVGARLFARDRTGIKLTEAGEALLRHTHAIAAHLRDAKREIGAFERLETGRVTLGAPTMVAAHLLPGLLARFKRKYPGVALTIRQGGAKMIEKAVRAGQMDIGIISDWHTASGVHVERIADRRMVACAAKRSAIARAKSLTWDRFLSQPLVLFPAQYYQRQMIDHVSRARGQALHVVAETDAIPLMIELVASGAGIATLLDAAAQAHSARIAAVALPSDAIVPMALCCRGLGDLSAAQRALWSHLKTSLGGQ